MKRINTRAKIVIVMAFTMVLSVVSAAAISAYPYSEYIMKEEIKDETGKELKQYIDTYYTGTDKDEADIEALKAEIIKEVEDSIKKGLIDDLIKEDKEEVIKAVKEMEERINTELKVHDEEELSTSISAIVEKNLIAGLEGSNKATNDNITILRSSYEQNMSELKTGYNKLLKELEASRNNLSSIKTEIEEIESADAASVVKTEALRQKLDKTSEDISSMEAYQKSLYSLTKAVETNASEEIKETAAAADKKAEAYAKNVRSEMQDDLSSAILKAEDENDAFKAEIEKLKAELEECRNTAESAKALEKDIENGKTERASIKKEVDSINGENDLIRDEIGNIAEEMGEVKSKAEENENKITEADKEIKASGKSINEIAKKCETNNKWEVSVSENILHIKHGDEDTQIPLSLLVSSGGEDGRDDETTDETTDETKDQSVPS